MVLKQVSANQSFTVIGSVAGYIARAAITLQRRSARPV